ncbi:magnesium chelatase ATPase subunit I [Alteriqipengyuania lutimaris]|uniref:Mg-protoporphyrin IX chelatase n=1 Tax=Alteriqipengyuania lutimaris TaxID=1538146 RepID=A0A395LKK0_9SPHN|nr:magnesium chelatase ATPase subunit I [Alteriqipengyuania lutimaris]MBB3033807.1 magnesium chelatase subunit I [Alteriqipengyuania lutimaris]RDS77219.1 magnesium chelatase ATPase subunit I [Alteriqipengyuania lutimaris]
MARFPFSAIVGQDEMKQALLIAAVDAGVGGVMVFGDRGTGKSTAARALANLLPPISAIRDCPYQCSKEDQARYPDVCGTGPVRKRAVPFVDLPLGATEDRVLGALDLERALRSGEKAFEPGLLAKAHRGFLYIDEINLLEDHLVDLLLDVAASGENVVEREGLSVRHPARFVLIGSGNPEEGELRPQLLDRFGLSVEVRTPPDIETRVEIMRRCAKQEADPEGFAQSWADEEAEVLGRIDRGRKRLAKVAVPDAMLTKAAELCMAVGADGLRGELTLMRAARALAALAGAKTLTEVHLVAVAPSALRHRLRREVLDETGSTVRIERAIAEVF